MNGERQYRDNEHGGQRLTNRVVVAVGALLISLALQLEAFGQSSAPDAKTENDITRISDGQVSGNVYRNQELGLRYEFPSGWIVNDKATQAKAIADQRQFVWADDNRGTGGGNPTPCSKGLLLLTRRPEGMLADGFNSLGFLIAANPRCLPGVAFPTTVKDHDAIEKIGSNLGIYFKAQEGTVASPGRVRAFDVGGRIMLEVSQTFQINSHRPGNAIYQSVNSSVLIMQSGDYWIMLMCVTADAPDMQKLRTSKIFFDPVTK